MDSRLAGPDQSLNAPVSNADDSMSERQDFLVSHAPLQDELVGDQIDTERRSAWIKNALSVLSDRELKIVKDRRLSEQGATLESLGNTLGISKERVRQIENRALQKMKDALLHDNRDQSHFVN